MEVPTEVFIGLVVDFILEGVGSTSTFMMLWPNLEKPNRPSMVTNCRDSPDSRWKTRAAMLAPFSSQAGREMNLLINFVRDLGRA